MSISRNFVGEKKCCSQPDQRRLLSIDFAVERDLPNKPWNRWARLDTYAGDVRMHIMSVRILANSGCALLAEFCGVGERKSFTRRNEFPFEAALAVDLSIENAAFLCAHFWHGICLSSSVDGQVPYGRISTILEFKHEENSDA